MVQHSRTRRTFRLTRASWVGVGIIFAGVSLFLGRMLWSETRNFVPVDIPINLSAGQVTAVEFRTNITGHYLIEVVVQRNIEFQRLNCLLGVEDLFPERCQDTPSVINASWTLSRKGAVLAQGVSKDHKGGAWDGDSISRYIGSFEAKRGETYRLEVVAIADGNALAKGNPHMRVEAPVDAVGESITSAGILIISLLAVGLGFAIVIVSASVGSYLRKDNRAVV